MSTSGEAAAAATQIDSIESKLQPNDLVIKVKMSCSGCSGAITKVLEKNKKDNFIDQFQVNLDRQDTRIRLNKSTQDQGEDWMVTNFKQIFRKMKKTGKQVTPQGELQLSDGTFKTIQLEE